MTINAITNASPAYDDALLESLLGCIDSMNRSTSFIRDMKEELKAKDRQIQELKEELAKSRRREEILESLYTAQESHSWSVSHKDRICNESYDLYQDLKLRLSEDGLPEDVRADLEKKMAEEREEFLAVQAEIMEQERKHNELVKSLKDELDTLK